MNLQQLKDMIEEVEQQDINLEDVDIFLDIDQQMLDSITMPQISKIIYDIFEPNKLKMMIP